jgi:hypothetical protein
MGGAGCEACLDIRLAAAHPPTVPPYHRFVPDEPLAGAGESRILGHSCE